MTIAKQHTIDDFLSFIRENDGGLFSFGEAGAGPDKGTARQSLGPTEVQRLI